MKIASTAQRIRDSRPATVSALGIVVLAQVPILAVFGGVRVVGDSFVGATALWVLGACVWTGNTAVHLLAPLTDVRDHPHRESWGPFETFNVYTDASVRHIWVRLLHGLLGFVVAFFGVVLFVATPLLLVFPVAVVMLATVVMSTHIGTKDPSEGTRRRL